MLSSKEELELTTTKAVHSTHNTKTELYEQCKR